MSIPRGVDPRQRRSPAEWSALGIVCPRCRGELTEAAATADTALADAGRTSDTAPADAERTSDSAPADAERTSDSALACVGCHARYDVFWGIPDLRTGEDPYLSRAEDRAAATRLAALSGTLDFAALFASYYDGNDKVPTAQVAQFTRGVLAAGGRATGTLDDWRDVSGASSVAGLVALDVGCGTAPLGIALAREGARVLAVDVGLRWLVLARVRAAEAGLDLPVVCANAEALPLRDGAVQCVAGESVLENLADPASGLRESHRVLSRGGRLWLTTPNKSSLGPDPHLGVLAGGWWPEARLRRYAERTGKVFPTRRLFTGTELRRGLGDVGFRDVRLALPRIAESQRAGLPPWLALAIGGYHLARRLPLARSLVLSIGPTMLCTAVRE